MQSLLKKKNDLISELIENDKIKSDQLEKTRNHLVNAQSEINDLTKKS